MISAEKPPSNELREGCAHTALRDRRECRARPALPCAATRDPHTAGTRRSARGCHVPGEDTCPLQAGGSTADLVNLPSFGGHHLLFLFIYFLQTVISHLLSIPTAFTDLSRDNPECAVPALPLTPAASGCPLPPWPLPASQRTTCACLEQNRLVPARGRYPIQTT